ncbi:MAG: GNAT family N-acetyltransferase [Terracidiphilus sp.]
MIFRLYQPADFNRLYAVEERCFEPPFRFPRGQMRRLVGCSQAATWIAEEHGQMTGFAIVEWTERRSGTTAYLQTIEVVPEARGRGVGGQLLERCEEAALEAGAGRIGLHVEAANEVAIRLYETHGYRAAGRRENYYPQGRAALLYEKPLVA